jgi:hypothetical protein
MTSKRGLKDIINELFESSLISSKFIQKIVQNITMIQMRWKLQVKKYFSNGVKN